jgi:hypothetical protein
MYYAELTVAEPIEKLLGDWDLLEERVVKKLTAFKELNDQVIGVRRRLFEKNAVFDRVKGKLPESLELTPKGIVATKYEMLTLNMTVGGTPHRVPNSFGYWHINDERYYKSSQFGLEGHYKANLAAIREYNGDVRLRTCPECGHVNPLAYAWNTVKDTPEEAAARKVW